MRNNLSVRAKNQIYAAWKWCVSLLKRDSELSAYPVVMREQEIDPNPTKKRLKSYRYSARILNWWVMSGGGQTQEEALQELEDRFARAKVEKANMKKPIPRPGARVPIEFASRERISFHRGLENDFVRRVLGLEWALISDESTLWDFHDKDTNDPLIAKIKEVYGVDVLDIKSANIAEILERIDSQQ